MNAVNQSTFLKPARAETPNEPNHTAPLASVLRPKTLKDFAGQKHLVGPSGPIRKLIQKDKIYSMIFWGPPGCGKTTLAQIIANQTKSQFVHMSAVDSGKADVKKSVELARATAQAYPDRRTILFLDEIHRFNKAQQDFLLP
ncbi:MAG: AAA family ATPase, partial [Patescibacteria group bacterium]|nr:AAA family ATPase [Patescibacteria group bacterium]